MFNALTDQAPVPGLTTNDFRPPNRGSLFDLYIGDEIWYILFFREMFFWSGEKAGEEMMNKLGGC